MADEIIELVKGSYVAFGKGDRAKMESLLAEDFHFTTPLDNAIDRKTYFERCWPGSGKATFEFIYVARAGEQVFITYEGRWSPTKAGRNTEVATVRGGKIVAVEVFFGSDVPHKAAPGGFVDPS